jgi:DNA-binding CsgD family transcriptional regulator/ArsR family metal-binding transcriptional regulator
MLVKGYHDFSLSIAGAPPRNCLGVEENMCAHFRLMADVSPLFPYINSVAPAAAYFNKPLFIRFLLDDFLVGLHPRQGVAAPFADREQALEFLERLLIFLNDIHRRRDTIAPNHKRWKPVAVLDIYRLLPRTNCRTCGFATCLAFAAALSQQQISPESCPALARPMSEHAVYPVLNEQGQVLSTVTIELDSSRLQNHLEKKPPSPYTLEGRPGDRARQPEALRKNGNGFLPTPLTDRELEVLRLVARGDTNAEISGHLGISRHTVKSHVIHIFNKLGVNDRTQAAVWAARHQIV